MQPRAGQELHVRVMRARQLFRRGRRAGRGLACEARDDVSRLTRPREPPGQLGGVEHVGQRGEDAEVFVGLRGDADHEVNRLARIPLDPFG